MRRTAICSLAMVLFAVVLGFCQVTTTKQTENPGFPRVVASISLHGKTGDIKPITLFTPKHFGVYRISGVLVVTTQLDNNLYGSILYRDGGGSKYLSFAALPSVGEYPVGPFVFRDLFRVPIQLFVNSYGEQGGKYNLFVVIEQIM
jgi:hypothetical protein